MGPRLPILVAAAHCLESLKLTKSNFANDLKRMRNHDFNLKTRFPSAVGEPSGAQCRAARFPLPQLSNPSAKRFLTKVIGVGDAGCRAADMLAGEAMPGVDFLALNSDAQGLRAMKSAEPIQLGRNLLRGLSAGGDPQSGRASAQADRELLAKRFDGADMVIFLGGLGRGTASGALPVVARQAREIGALVLSFVSLPFDFEGPQCRRQADAGLNELLAASDAVISLPNQAFLQIVDKQTPMPKTFETINSAFAQGVRGVWQMVERPGLIDVSFQDLRAVVRNKRAQSSFAIAEAEGKNRLRQAVEGVLAYPLLAGAEGRVEDSDVLLVNIVGGDNLKISEVQWIGEQLRRRAGKAKVILGASTDSSLEEKVGLTLIASWHRKRKATALKIQSTPEDDVSFSVQIEGSNSQTPSFKQFEEMPKSTSKISARSSGWENPRRPGKRRFKQEMLNLDVVPGGLFEKSPPAVYGGENLDVPTFVRRGRALN